MNQDATNYLFIHVYTGGKSKKSSVNQRPNQ